MHDLSRTPCFSPSEMQNKFSVTDRFCSTTGTSKWNQVRKFSTTSTLLWQKQQVFDSFVSVFLLSRSSRGCKMVMWKPTGPIQRLAARSTPSAIAPGRSKSPLLLSAKFSAQSKLNDIFDFFRLAVADKNGHDPSTCIIAKAFEPTLRHVLLW